MKIGIFLLKSWSYECKKVTQGIKGSFHPVAQEYYEQEVVGRVFVFEEL
jgi:hypothetical protein